MRTAWHGSMFTSKRQLVFQNMTTKAYTCIALEHYVDSCCLVLPCTFKKIPKTEIYFVIPDKGLSQPLLIPVVDLSAYDVWQYQSRSYLGLYFGYPDGRSYYTPGSLFVMMHVHVLSYSTPNRCELRANHVVF